MRPDMNANASLPHWVIPHACSLSAPCQALLQRWPDAPQALPHLRQLLSRMQLCDTLVTDEYSCSMPHERLLAQQLQWPDADGRLPWAQWWAARDGVHLDSSQHWLMLSPCHWRMGREHLTMGNPQDLALDEASAGLIVQALRPLFEDDGWQLIQGSPTRWYAAHAQVDGLVLASLDRVIGRNPDLWLGEDPRARPLRRLQAEIQMLLYGLPLNDQREQAGLLPVNCVWFSGAGPQVDRLQWSPQLQVVGGLRRALLADDMQAWHLAWQAIDRDVLGPLVQALDAGQGLRLSLCGERTACTWQSDGQTRPAPGTQGSWASAGLKWAQGLWAHGLAARLRGRATPSASPTPANPALQALRSL